MVTLSVVAALLIGFLGGLLTFKRKQLWCPACGQTLTCRSCLVAAAERGRL